MKQLSRNISLLLIFLLVLFTVSSDQIISETGQLIDKDTGKLIIIEKGDEIDTSLSLPVREVQTIGNLTINKTINITVKDCVEQTTYWNSTMIVTEGYIDCPVDWKNASCTNITTDKVVDVISGYTQCVKKGAVYIGNKTFIIDDFWCQLEGNEIVCISNKEGGQWNTCKKDGSVTCYKKNLITNQQVEYNSAKTNIMISVGQK